MVFRALSRPWKLILVIIVIWFLLNYLYAFIYFGYYKLETCFYFIFDQTYRADAGYLSILLDSKTPYF